MKRRWLYVILVALAVPTGGRAQESAEEPIATDRPDFTETAETVPAGRAQLEGGYTFARTDDERAATLGELLLRIAAGPRAEFRLEAGSYTWTRGSGERADGLEDIAVGFKVSLAQGSPRVAVIGMTTLPTGASAYREDKLQPEAKLCFDWDLSPRLGLGSNLNYTYAREEGERFDQFSGSVAVGYDVTQRTGGYLEVFGFAPSGRGGSDTSYVNGGVTYLVNNDYQIDARVGIGLNGKANDYFLGVGAARRW